MDNSSINKDSCFPLITIIIPVYNVENYIQECLHSICIQKMNDADVEVICIDDGSTDKSGFICDEIAAIDNRIKVYHKSNGGVSSARNLGLSLARGKYIAWIDPDDYISEDWYEIIKKYIIQFNPDILVIDYYKDDKKDINSIYYKSSERYIGKDEFLYDISEDCIIQSQLWQKIINRELFKNIKFPNNVRCLEDYAVLHKIILQSKIIYYCHHALYYYRYRNDSLVNYADFEKAYNSYLVAFERYKELKMRNIKFSKIGLILQALGVCITFYKIKDKEKFRKQYIECKQVLKTNVKYILGHQNIGIINKIKIILLIVGMFPVIGNIYRLLKRIGKFL